MFFPRYKHKWIWFSLLWPLSTLRDHDWFEETSIDIIPESFHVNMTYSGKVVLEKKIFKWPHPIWVFCDYLPLEEDLALYLNNLESPWSKDDLYKVWLKLTCWFWRRFFFKINTCKYGYFYSAIVAPPNSRDHDVNNSESTLYNIRKLSCKYDLFCLSGSGEDF
jgi:hypothetical protein